MYCDISTSSRFGYSITTNGLGLSRQHPSQEGQRAALVEPLVQVAALRRLDAGRAAVLAGTACEQALRVLDPALEHVEAPLGDADAAGMAVVDEHGRPAGLEVDVRAEAADVPAVAHRPQGQERDEGVLRGVQAREQRRHRLEALELRRLGEEPDRLR